MRLERPLAIALLAVGLLVGRTAGAAPAFNVEIDAPRPLAGLLAAHLDITRYASQEGFLPAQLERAVAGVADDARGLLATEGYFSPRVEVRLDATTSPPTVRVVVDPGDRARVRNVALRVTGPIADGPAADPRRVAAMSGRWELPKGAAFTQDAWNDAKNRLLRELLVDRFPYARVADSRAEIDPALAAADLEVVVDSGPLVRFGRVRVNGIGRYDERNVRNLRPFAEGEPYRQDLLLEFQARLQTTGYFESAVVALAPAADPDGTAPVVVTVVEEPYQKIRLGGGYSTNTGFRVSVEHEHNDILVRNYRLLSTLRLESKAQTAQVELVSPPDDTQATYRTIARAGATEIQGLKTRGAGLRFGRIRDRERVETQFFGQVLYETREPAGADREDSTMATVNYSWTRRAIDNVIAPTRGWVLNLQGGAGVPIGGRAESTFLRGYAKAALFVPFGDDVAIFRGELGSVQAKTRKGIPEEFLFRAGGDQSVRGYGFQQLGVREGDATVGGRHLFTASAEYVHRILPDWGIAVFADAGSAADRFGDLDPAYGFGVGARWRSPVGPVGVDVAYGEAFNQVRVHFSLGFTF